MVNFLLPHLRLAPLSRLPARRTGAPASIFPVSDFRPVVSYHGRGQREPMRRRFFVENFEGATAAVRGEAAHHLGRVLRAEPGQLYELSDGESVWLGRVERVARDEVQFALVEQLPARATRLRVILLLAIVKFDRFEWSLEKATELGVSEIVPLATVRSEKALVTAAGKRAARWQKILVEAAQQARRLRAPVLRTAMRPADAFRHAAGLELQRRGAESAEKGMRANDADAAIRIVLSERPDAPALRAMLEGKRSAGAAVAIGPEGGWIEEELAAARAAGFEEVSLGQNILRTETAVVAALAALNYALGDSEGLF